MRVAHIMDGRQSLACAPASLSGSGHIKQTLEELETELAVCKLVLLNTYTCDVLDQMLSMYTSLVKHAAGSSGPGDSSSGADSGAQSAEQQEQAQPRPQVADAASQTVDPVPARLDDAVALWCDAGDVQAEAVRPEAHGAQAQPAHVMASGSAGSSCGAGEQSSAGFSGKVAGTEGSSSDGNGCLARRWDLEFWDTVSEAQFAGWYNGWLLYSDLGEINFLLLMLALTHGWPAMCGSAFVACMAAVLIINLLALLARGGAPDGSRLAGLRSWYTRHREAVVLGVRLIAGAYALLNRRAWLSSCSLGADDVLATVYSTGMLAVPALFFRVRLSRHMVMQSGILAATTVVAVTDYAAGPGAGMAWRELARVFAPCVGISWLLPTVLLYYSEKKARLTYLHEEVDGQDGGAGCATLDSVPQTAGKGEQCCSNFETGENAVRRHPFSSCA